MALETALRQLVQAIHDTPHQLTMVTAGAGTQALSDLLSVSGASRSLLEAIVPYSAAAFDEFLGQTPHQYVASKTAKLLAGRALTRARWLSSASEPVVGLACTATIITDRPKRGEHRAHIACWTPARLVCHSLHLHKGGRDRAGEERLVSRLLLNTLADACGVPDQLQLPLTTGDHLETSLSDFTTVATRLHRGDIPFAAIHDHGLIRTTGVRPQVLLSGAFNPLHQGHLELARAAGDLLQQPVAFELSLMNVDKPPLAEPVVCARLAQFAGRYAVYASRAATFVEKAALYPGATFVVGVDTARRIIHPRYYNDNQEAMLAALATIGERQCRFLVAGRVAAAGDFHELADLPIPAPFADLFTAIPGSVFRQDISSTALRAAQAKGSR